MKKILSLVLGLSLCFGLCAPSLAQEPSDFYAALPLLDLVTAASQNSVNAPESVPGSEGQLSAAFVEAFLLAGLSQSSEVGITSATLGDTAAQQKLLSSIFAAQLPELAARNEIGGSTDFVGFCPRAVYPQEDGSVKVFGGIYTAPKALRELSGLEFAQADWFETGAFILRSDAASPFGWRVEGFQVGSDMLSDENYQDYTDTIAVEYMSSLGFSILYPADFTDDLLVEDSSGVSATLPDGSASFYAMRSPNTQSLNLESCVGEITSAYPTAVSNLGEDGSYATVFYLEEDGCAVYDVIAVTADYIYQAELKCDASLLCRYSMYQSYMKNSFIINELSLG